MLSTLRINCCYVLAAFSVSFFTSSARADVVVASEDFADSAENWFNSDGTLPLDYVATGGADGNGYVSTSYSFENSTAGSSTVLFRGQEEFGFSDLEFTGNWITSGARKLSAQVRHNAPVPLNYFVRVSDPANFPGAVAIQFAPVPPGQWSPLSFDLGKLSPQIVTFEGSDWFEVFNNVGHVQFGVSVPAALAETSPTYTFDLDAVVTETPEPASIVLAFIAFCAGGAAMRKRTRS